MYYLSLHDENSIFFLIFRFIENNLLRQISSAYDNNKRSKTLWNQGFLPVYSTHYNVLIYARFLVCLTLLQSEWSQLHRVVAVLSAVGLNLFIQNEFLTENKADEITCKRPLIKTI